jgi:hypothetical protein
MPRRPVRGLRTGRVRSDRYELVFVLLLMTFVLGAFSDEGWTRVPSLALNIAALLIAIRSAQLTGRAARSIRLVLGGGSLLLAVVVLLLPSTTAQGVFACWVAVVLLTTILVIVRRILRHRYVTMQTIFGALSAYLLIGFFFAAVFSAVSKLVETPFFAGGQAVTPASAQYFSFVTLSTTGYGDYTAQGNGGRSMAVLEAVLGQVFLVTLVARLVALYGMLRPTPARADDGRDGTDSGNGGADGRDDAQRHSPGMRQLPAPAHDAEGT